MLRDGMNKVISRDEYQIISVAGVPAKDAGASSLASVGDSHSACNDNVCSCPVLPYDLQSGVELVLREPFAGKPRRLMLQAEFVYLLRAEMNSPESDPIVFLARNPIYAVAGL
jgi:hypothetical protein